MDDLKESSINRFSINVDCKYVVIFVGMIIY